MGFGFNLGFIFIVLPLTGILLLIWAITKNKAFGIVLGIIWGGIIGLVILSTIMQTVFATKVLEKDDYYGEYIIDRTYFPGKQADWQYDHYRFEIKNNDSIFFYYTNKEKILKIYRGTIRTITPYQSEVLVINMEQPTHHVLTTDPTVHRETWSFYLVFNSPKFSNMFFKKGQWERID